MLTGLVSGLGAALSQSLSYLATRHFNHNRRNAGRLLLVVGHLWMGLLAILVLGLVWPRDARGISLWSWLAKVWLPVVLMTGCYLVGQVGMTLALKHVEPSRVSPLLGIKIIFLALVSSVVPQPQWDTAAAPAVGLTWMQWAGVLLSVAAGIALNFAGAALRRRALAAILLACLAFTFSDWNIAAANKALHAALPAAGVIQVSLLNAGLCYLLAALPALLAAPLWGTRQTKDWVDAAPFAVFWFAGMLFLFWCMAEVGPLLGAILQSTRGLISILLGPLVLHWGHAHMEPHSPRKVLAGRLAAGILMFLAVALYVLKSPENLTVGTWHLR